MAADDTEERAASLCVKCPRSMTQSVLEDLRERGLIEKGLLMDRDREHVFIPVSKRFDTGMEFVTREFVREERPPMDYRSTVRIPEDLRELLPRAFDTLGGIAIIKLPDELMPHRSVIGRALLASKGNVSTVLLDRGVKGGFRVRDVEVVAGQHTFTTVHREYGISLKVDVSRAYFSPRLATEHRTVAGMVRPGEVVLDAFAGVGPFSIMIARHSRPARVMAVDLNPDAVSLMKENIMLNKVSNVEVVEGDLREVLPGLGTPDRVIMNHPTGAMEFVEDVFGRVPDGGVVHYHDILAEDEIAPVLDELKIKAKRCGMAVELVERREVRNYSPATKHYCFDLALSRN